MDHTLVIFDLVYELMEEIFLSSKARTEIQGRNSVSKCLAPLQVTIFTVGHGSRLMGFLFFLCFLGADKLEALGDRH